MFSKDVLCITNKMKKTPYNYLFKNIISAFALLIVFSTSSIQAQFRNYNIVYTDNARGDIAMFGNTLMAIVDTGIINTAKMNNNAADGNSIYGNDFENL